MKKFVVICLLLLPAVAFAQNNPLAKEKWQNLINSTYFSATSASIEKNLVYGSWYSGLLIYQDGTAKETSICITSFHHLSLPNGRLKTTNFGEITKNDLKAFIIGDFYWIKKANRWGVAKIKGPLSIFMTYNKLEIAETYLVNEDSEQALVEVLSSGFRKKMKVLVGDCTAMMRSIENKEEGYTYSPKNVTKLLHEYNEWIRINDPNRYQSAMQLIVNR